MVVFHARHEPENHPAPGAWVFVDTDAELTERGASLAGIGAADSLALVLSTSWADYLRTLDDPANSLFAALVSLAGRHPELSPRVAHVVFNGVQKRLSAPSGFESAPGVLPFTPPSSALESIAEISAHLRSVACDPATGYARFFAIPETLASDAGFVKMYVTTVPAVPDGAWPRARRTPAAHAGAARTGGGWWLAEGALAIATERRHGEPYDLTLPAFFSGAGAKDGWP